jgi:oligopeptide/dipeptide ABC transporter ATP-binding protein
VLFNGTDLQQLTQKQRRKVLGSGIGMVFQDPNTSLNPVVPIGRQITEGMRFNLGIGRREARERAADLLNQVGIADPRARMRQYPHQLSGGMRQRVTIACALACDPEVLIADEATTALDVTVQKQLLDLLASLQQARGTAMLLISHDLGVVAGRADDLAVMYLGQIVEIGPTRQVFQHRMHRYTAALLAANPSLDDTPHAQLRTIPGTPPPLAGLPPGCRFALRCQAAADDCAAGIPDLLPAADPGHMYRCFHPVMVGPTAVSGPRS